VLAYRGVDDGDDDAILVMETSIGMMNAWDTVALITNKRIAAEANLHEPVL
jgi:hypothetical protein